MLASARDATVIANFSFRTQSFWNFDNGGAFRFRCYLAAELGTSLKIRGR
jgi:hypothetical protein